MYTWLSEVITTPNERLFTPEEIERLEDYYETVPSRLEAAEAVERLETRLIAHIATSLQSAHPEIVGTERLAQDVAESVRVAVHAMLADEPKILETRLLHHLRTLVGNVNAPAPELHTAYVALQDGLKNGLPSQSADLMAPHLQKIVEVVTPPKKRSR